jgi:hypothetical protein
VGRIVPVCQAGARSVKREVGPSAGAFLDLRPVFDPNLSAEGSTLRQLLAWTHSGFSLDAGEKPVAPHDVEGRKPLAEYLLRASFSLEKITWNESSGKVIYRSKRSWHTKRNFQIFEAVDFLAATVEHIPPKGQQTVRYYGLYSNKIRGMAAKTGRLRPEMRDALRPEPQENSPSDFKMTNRKCVALPKICSTLSEILTQTDPSHENCPPPVTRKSLLPQPLPRG